MEAEVSGGRETFLNYVWSFSDGQIKPILVYDDTFVPDIEDYVPLTIGNMYTGTGDSILLELVHTKIGYSLAPLRKNINKI